MSPVKAKVTAPGGPVDVVTVIDAAVVDAPVFDAPVLDAAVAGSARGPRTCPAEHDAQSNTIPKAKRRLVDTRATP